MLAIAWQLREQYELRVAAATASRRKRLLGREDLPERLYVELAATADFQHDAALTLLTNPGVAFAPTRTSGASLMPSDKLAWVLGRDTKRPMGTVLQRAACLSLSRARELEDLYREAAAAKKAGKVSANRARKVRELYEQIHDQIGCPWASDTGSWPCRRLRSHACTGTNRCRHQENWPCQPKKRPHQLVVVTLEGLERQLWPRKRRQRFLLAQHKVGGRPCES